MKIKLPQKYMDRFPKDKVFISRWKNKSLILMNVSEHSELLEGIEKMQTNETKGMVNFIKVGVFEAKIEEGVIEIPQWLTDFIESTDIIFSEQGDKLTISGEIK